MKDSEGEECKKFIDKIIKTNREIFIMSSLLDRHMCGYDIIKDIFLRCNVFLSQGTVYPILYSLEEKGILQAEHSKSDMRSKKYSLTSRGREIAIQDIENFIRAMDHIRELIER